jgi:hypothetical protein
MYANVHIHYPSALDSARFTFMHWNFVLMTALARINELLRAFAGIHMLSAIYFDSTSTANERRTRLFKGDILVFAARRSTSALCCFARRLIEKSFGSGDPRTAQQRVSTQEFTSVISKLKPEFAHHPAIDGYMRDIFEEFGCDLSKVYYDVPKMRFSTSDGYLTKGLAQVWHPHRDTWYSAPLAQLNWWIPIYDITEENAMAFYPNYWGRAISNDSAAYNYYQANRARRDPSLNDPTKPDPRILPRPTQMVDGDSQLRVVCPAGGVIMFSGAHLHATVPNTSGLTRFSFDFRTVHEDDLRCHRGALKIDEDCKGTSLRDFHRVGDHASVPEEVVASYDDQAAQDGGDLVFQHT